MGRFPSTLKEFLTAHALGYFMPGPEGLSEADKDLALLSPAERIDAEIKILNYVQPKMQATTIDTAASESQLTLEQRMHALMSGE